MLACTVVLVLLCSLTADRNTEKGEIIEGIHAPFLAAVVATGQSRNVIVRRSPSKTGTEHLGNLRWSGRV